MICTSQPTLSRLRRLMLLCIIAWLAALPMTARGQGDGSHNAATAAAADTASAASDEAELQNATAGRTLLSIIRDGGYLMFPLLACSFTLLVFTFERAISLRGGRVIPNPFVKRFLHQLESGQLDKEQALLICAENNSPVSRIFAAATKKWARPSVEMEQSIMDAGERAANELRRFVRVFNGLATVSPLLGLLGTVFGIIRAFNDIAGSDAMGRMEMLSRGISEALFTTAMGLSVAIPAVCLYMYFTSCVDRLVIKFDSLGQEVVAMISAEALQEAAHAKSRTKKAA
ncbi:MAG: MotA/TolQ/ExbB proton channel family protein [Pirellulales bacterium]